MMTENTAKFMSPSQGKTCHATKREVHEDNNIRGGK